MEWREVERSSPSPPQPLLHLAEQDGQNMNADGAPAVTARGAPTAAADDGTDGTGGTHEQPPAQRAASVATPTEEDNAALADDRPPEDPPPAEEGGIGDLGEQSDIHDLPEGDLNFDDELEEAQPSTAEDDFDLAPLPTEFDPDAPLPDLPASTVPEDDELALVPREEPEPPSEPAAEAEPEQQAAAEDAPQADDAEATEQADHADQDIYAVIRGLADPGLQWGDGEEGAEVETEAMGEGDAHDAEQAPMDVDHLPEEEPREPSPAPSSPLTPLGLPELPNELSLDVDIPPSRLPPSILAPELQTSEPAESSRAALRRTRGVLSSASPALNGSERRQSFGRSDTDDFESDGGEKRERYKRRKGLDGKLIRASARPRKRIDKQLQIERDGQKPPEKVAPRARTLTDTRLKALVRGKRRELQLAPCIRKRYGPWGKCTQCVSKIGGDSCRFRNYRVFPLDPATGEITGAGWFESTTLEDPLTPLPNKFNVELTEAHISRIEKTVAPLLVGLISREMRHVIKNNALHRPIDTAQHRSVCDFCSSTIFAGFWFCTKCGRDYCIECERFFSASAATLTVSPWPVPEATRPRLHRCTRGNETLPLSPKPPKAGKLKQQMHFRDDLQAASRLSADELRADFLALINFVLEPGASDMDIEARVASLALDDEETDLAEGVRNYLTRASPSASSTEAPLSEADVQKLYDASKTLRQPPDPTDIKPLPFMYIDGDKLDGLPGAFDALWARGEPMVVDNLMKRLQKQWTPDNFIRRFKDEPCFVVDCESEHVMKTSVGAFFLLFKELGGETSVPNPVPVLTNGTANGVRPDEADRAAHSTGRSLSPHQSMTVHKAPSHEPTATGSVQSAGPVSGKSSGNGTPDVEESSRSPAAVPAQTTPGASSAARPILPAPAQRGSVSGSGTGTPQRAYTFEEQVAQMASWAPGYAVLKAEQRILKLKDWPSTDDFASAYPDLYEDFSRALPAPDFTQRIGVLNLYSHFPPGPTRPDIGPKMYNALAGREEPGSFGSTRLHMDVADAVNIMLYASKRADGSPGCAVWDLFRAEDADKIRAFLKGRFPHIKMTDPIHSQLFYLDSELREELHAQYGVASFRVYQYPGQAVFVPAGCAHQVCNLANCMKIALDFVSPHNVRRCQRLTQDFRKENYVRVWKEDVLQLYNVMWYAWTNVRGIREARKQAEIARHWLARLNAGQVPHLPGHPAVGRQPQYPHSRTYPHPYAPAREDSRYHSFAPTPAWSSMRDDPSPRVGAESAVRGQSTPPTAVQSAPPEPNAPQAERPVRSPSAAEATPTPVAEGGPTPPPPTSSSDAVAVSANAEAQANGRGAAITEGQEPKVQDKNPESASDSAREIPPANDSAETVSSPPLPSPREELARRLMEAALAREPKPELHVDPTPKASAQRESYDRHNSRISSAFGDSDLSALPDLMDLGGETGFSDVDMLG
ncbi:unnamed protein product [Cutaneotrichosporon oleaginosum]